MNTLGLIAELEAERGDKRRQRELLKQLKRREHQPLYGHYARVAERHWSSVSEAEAEPTCEVFHAAREERIKSCAYLMDQAEFRAHKAARMLPLYLIKAHAQCPHCGGWSENTPTKRAHESTWAHIRKAERERAKSTQNSQDQSEEGS